MKLLLQTIAAFLLLLASTVAAQGQQQHRTPVVKRFVAPEYSGLAKLAGVSGSVSAQVSILQSGAVEKVEIVSGEPILAERVKTALSQWTFEPIEESKTLMVTVRFTLVYQATDIYATRVSAELPDQVEVSANVRPPETIDDPISGLVTKTERPELLIDRVEHGDSGVVVRIRVCNRTEAAVFFRKSEFSGQPLLPGLAIEQWRNSRWIAVSTPSDVPTRSVLKLLPDDCVQQDIHLVDFDRIFKKGTERVAIKGQHRARLWYARTRQAALDSVKNRRVIHSKPFVIP